MDLLRQYTLSCVDQDVGPPDRRPGIPAVTRRRSY